MSMIEISEDEAKALRGSKALMDQLLKSPKTRRDAEKLVKTLYPETQTTDDLAEPYVQKIDALSERFDKFLKTQEGERLDSKLNRDLDTLRSQGYTEDGLDKIKHLMVKETIPNALAAAAFWEKQNPPKPAAPSQLSPTDWGFGRQTDDADITSLFKDEDAWAEDTARKVWAEEAAKKGQILT